MKHIEKGGEPPLLRQWRLDNKKTPQNLRYGNIPKDARDAIRGSLLKEQGGLCAYTMWRIGSVEAGHIEHIHPQSRPPISAQVSYANMVYCHPGDGAPECPFGARKKANEAVSSQNFVSPLNPSCERRFRFKTNGTVQKVGMDDTVAQNTIDVLCLNHGVLKLAREFAILELPIFRGGNVSASEASRRARLAFERNRDGMFSEFALAIQQTWARYAEQRAEKEFRLG